MEYNLTLDDSLLITHVFSNIDQTWRWMSGFADIPSHMLSWADVSSALQKQDNSRRQGNQQSQLIMPLGWISRVLYNRSKEAVAHAAQGKPPSTQTPKKDSESSAAPGEANAAEGSKTKYVPKGGAGGGKPHNSNTSQNPNSGGQGQKKESFFICFCCFEFGHGCIDCPKRLPGWKITSESRAKALALKNQKIERMSKGNAQVAQAAQGETPVL